MSNYQINFGNGSCRRKIIFHFSSNCTHFWDTDRLKLMTMHIIPLNLINGKKNNCE